MLNQSIKKKIDELDEQTVLLILGYLTEELQREIPTDQITNIQSEEEACIAISALLETMEENYNQRDATVIVTNDAHFTNLAPQILKLFIDDETTCPKIENLVNNPPTYSQMSGELAITGAVVLGAVITWLQTKITIEVTRKGGKTYFKFELRKDAADIVVVKSVVQSIVSLWKDS